MSSTESSTAFNEKLRREFTPPPLPSPHYISGLALEQDVSDLALEQDPGWRFKNGSQHEVDSNRFSPYLMRNGSNLIGMGNQECKDHDDYRESRRASTTSLSIPIDPEMQTGDSVEYSDKNRNSLPRLTTMANIRYVSEELSLFG
jgi:hypothetical protein